MVTLTNQKEFFAIGDSSIPAADPHSGTLPQLDRTGELVEKILSCRKGGAEDLNEGAELLERLAQIHSGPADPSIRRDGGARLRVTNAFKLAEFSFQEPLAKLALDQQGKLLAAVTSLPDSKQYKITVRRTEDPSNVTAQPVTTLDGGGVPALGFSEDGKILLLINDFTIKIFRLETRPDGTISPLPMAAPSLSPLRAQRDLALTPDGSKFLRTAVLREYNTGELTYGELQGCQDPDYQPKKFYTSQPIDSAIFSADGSMIFYSTKEIVERRAGAWNLYRQIFTGGVINELHTVVCSRNLADGKEKTIYSAPNTPTIYLQRAEADNSILAVNEHGFLRIADAEAKPLLEFEPLLESHFQRTIAEHSRSAGSTTLVPERVSSTYDTSGHGTSFRTEGSHFVRCIKADPDGGFRETLLSEEPGFNREPEMGRIDPQDSRQMALSSDGRIVALHCRHKHEEIVGIFEL